jgi:agmatinase
LAKEFVHASEPCVFGGFRKPFESSRYAIFGVPFDGTVTYRPGQRFGPASVRAASAQLETTSLRFGIDLEDVGIFDLGDVGVSLNVEEVLRSVKETVERLALYNKVPVCIGGEHTVTMGALQGLKCETLIVFDAHLDLRDLFMGLRLSHASWLRRTVDSGLIDRALVVGARGFCKEELEYASGKVGFLTPLDLKGEKGRSSFRAFLEEAGTLYISVDLDAFDPAYAPGVGNPEPDGLSVSEVFSLFELIQSRDVIGFDAVEVSPSYDLGTTASLAGKTLFELISLCENRFRA